MATDNPYYLDPFQLIVDCQFPRFGSFSTYRVYLGFFPDDGTTKSSECINAGYDLDDKVNPNVFTNPDYDTYWSYNVFESDGPTSTITNTYEINTGNFSHVLNHETDYGFILQPCTTDRKYYKDGIELYDIDETVSTTPFNRTDGFYTIDSTEEYFRATEKKTGGASSGQILRTWSFTDGDYLDDLYFPMYGGLIYNTCTYKFNPQMRSDYDLMQQNKAGNEYIARRIDVLNPDDGSFCEESIFLRMRRWDDTYLDAGLDKAETQQYFIHATNVSTDKSTGTTTATFDEIPARTGTGKTYVASGYGSTTTIDVQDIKYMGFDDSDNVTTVTLENSGTETQGITSSSYSSVVNDRDESWQALYKVNGVTKLTGSETVSTTTTWSCTAYPGPTCSNTASTYEETTTTDISSTKYFICQHDTKHDLIVYAKVVYSHDQSYTQNTISQTWSSSLVQNCTISLYVDYNDNEILLDSIVGSKTTNDSGGGPITSSGYCFPYADCQSPQTGTTVEEVAMVVGPEFSPILVACDAYRKNAPVGQSIRTSALLHYNEYQVDPESGVLMLSTEPGIMYAILKAGTWSDKWFDSEFGVFTDGQICDMQRKGYTKSITSGGVAYDPMAQLFPGAVDSSRFCLQFMGSPSEDQKTI